MWRNKSHFLQKIFDQNKNFFLKNAKNNDYYFKIIIYIYHYFTNKKTYVYIFFKIYFYPFSSNPAYCLVHLEHLLLF